MTIKGYKQTPEHIAKRSRFGKDHPAWLGSGVSEKGGRTRALRMYPEIGPCVRCGSPRSERHHKDGNTANNSEENVIPLCRKCHMATDGRLSSSADRMKSVGKLGVVAAALKKSSMRTCHRGHELAGSNLYEHGGRRHCRACQRISAAAYQARVAARR